LSNAASRKLPSTEMCCWGQISTVCGLQDWWGWPRRLSLHQKRSGPIRWMPRKKPP